MGDGRPDAYGYSLGCDVRHSKTEGCSEGWTLGILDSKGFAKGWLLGPDDGCDVGQSEDEGCSEGWLLGEVILDGDLEVIDDGKPVTDGASLGTEFD